MRKWAKVAAVAGRQHLLIATWQLRLLGISDAELKERLAHHGWSRKGHGVVALPGPDTDRRKLAAAVLAYSRPTGAAARVAARCAAGEVEVEAIVEEALSGGQLISGKSALWLHGIARKPSTHTLRLTKKSGVKARPGVCLRLGPVTGTVTRIDGLPVVDVEQALLDVASGDDESTAQALHHELTKLIANADARRATTLDALAQRVQAAPRCLGKPALRLAVADLRGELAHSATEKAARVVVAKVLAKYGLRIHPRPYAVESGRRIVGEADLAVLAICLDIEIDGPHHLLPAQQEKDQLRDRWMRRAGWEVERFSTEIVDLWPVKFAAQVEECVRFRLGLTSGSDIPG
jgi:hypothetical protein